MAQEIELKLALPPAQGDRLRDHPLPARLQEGQPITQTLANHYFDTPDETLNRHAVALRIRRQGNRHIQTLKTRGRSSGGLHQRNEWEWELAGPLLDTSLLPADALPPSLEIGQLAPVFSTDFQRTGWQLRYPFEDSCAHIELVLDIGEARAGDGSDPISEIELELKSGPAAALFALALELAQDLPLRVTRISKAERGHRLLRPEQACPLPPPPQEGSAPAPWLERAQGAMEAYLFLKEPTLLETLHQALIGLDQAMPGAPLAPRLAELAPIRAMNPGAAQRQAAILWLDNPELGRDLLLISRALACPNG